MSDTTETSLVLLVVEDEENDQLLARHYLRRMASDVEVLCAFDGLEAIELLRDRTGRMPDMILLDINMPRMNGHDFLEAWFVEQGAEVPIVVMLTSSDQHEDKRRALEYANVVDYFLKPITKETVTRLGQILDVGEEDSTPTRRPAPTDRP